jgi:hypothetical protein
MGVVITKRGRAVLAGKCDQIKHWSSMKDDFWSKLLGGTNAQH